MLYWEKINAKQLENALEIVLKGESRPRRLGFTTLFYHLMLQEVGLGDHHNSYLLISHNRFQSKSALLDFTQLIEQQFGHFHQHVVERKDSTRIQLSNGQTFEFMDYATLKDRPYRGRSFDRVFVDVDLSAGDRVMLEISLKQSLTAWGDIV